MPAELMKGWNLGFTCPSNSSISYARDGESTSSGDGWINFEKWFFANI